MAALPRAICSKGSFLETLPKILSRSGRIEIAAFACFGFCPFERGKDGCSRNSFLRLFFTMNLVMARRANRD
jgi:hypothetical protein